MILFTKTYAKDAELCGWMLRCAHRMLSGWEHHVVVTEKADLDVVKQYCRGPRVDFMTVEDRCPDAMKLLSGQIRQRYLKLRASAFVGAQDTVQLDSDMIFHQPAHTSQIVKRWLYRPVDALTKPQQMRNSSWYQGTHHLLGWNDRDSMMEGLGWHINYAYADELCNHIEALHERPLVELIARLPERRYNFSEYVVYGTWLRKHDVSPQNYTWQDTSKHRPPDWVESIYHYDQTHDWRISEEALHMFSHWAAGDMSVRPPANRLRTWLT